MDKLATLNNIENRIAKIETIDEAKGIRNQAEALRVYAKSAKAGLGIQNRAAKIKILAEGRAGAILKTIPHNTPNGKKKGDGLLSTLKSNNIAVATAHRWEAISEIPTEKLEELEAKKTEAGEELTSGEIFQIARQQRAVRSAPPVIEESPPNPTGKFKTIVIDPPWPISKVILDRRPVEKESLDYSTMELEEITKLPVQELAEPDGCHVYLWFTHKNLPAALDLFSKWGVRYECIITWNKPTAQPLWWRFLTEHCLFGKIGTLPLVKKGCAVSFSAPQQKHSHKPTEFYDLVRTVSPAPRLTMFDYDRDGFQRWGVTH